MTQHRPSERRPAWPAGKPAEPETAGPETRELPDSAPRCTICEWLEAVITLQGDRARALRQEAELAQRTLEEAFSAARIHRRNFHPEVH